ncbi:DedA family protein [Myxosarcina sp. GI1]|uniref:DedA family protein n=1 Tax=Myxosarcina sp. GI1 TaxID=1541065 RepID=UPI000560FC29|nr:DedA family protein [Myxosarcina sp. GI1]
MLEWITNTVDSLGYVGIGLLMLLENLFPPIPSELIMPLAGFAVIQGKLQLVYVIVAGVIGSVLGALPWYYLGKVWGLRRIKRFVDRYGKWLSVSSEDIDRARQWFQKRGRETTCFSRLVPGVRTYISVPAGISKMPLLPFLVYSTIGTALWVSFLTYAGFLLGENYDRVKQYLAPVSTIVLVVFVVAFVFWIIRRNVKQK